MKKSYILMIALAICANSFAQNSTQEAAPFVKNTNNIPSKASFDIYNSYTLITPTAPSGLVGLAASNYMFGKYYVAKWNGDSLYRFDNSGNFIDNFVIAGLSGIRALTTDGTNIYASNNTGTIYRIDPTTNTLNPPHITASTSFNVRGCSYSPALNSGAGGFWVSAFGSDFVSISMTGATLSTIPAATHGLTGVYGIAVDDYTPGGPYLWAFAQGAPNSSNIVGVRVSDGSIARAAHDVFADISGPHSLTSSLAGGLFISNAIVTGQTHIGGAAQGSPANVLFIYELNNPFLSLDENKATAFSAYPNPASADLTIEIEAFSNYSLHDLAGNLVTSGTLSSGSNKVDVSNLNRGSYLLTVVQNETKFTKMVVLQ